MSDTVKLIIEIPRNEYEYTCERTLSDRTFWDDAIRKGIPLDDVKAEIEASKWTDKEFRFERNALASGLEKALEILDNIGKESEADFPQAKDIDPTVKNFSKILDIKLISNATEEERCCFCGGIKRFGICQDCGSDM